LQPQRPQLLKTAFSAIVIPTRYGVGFYPGQAHSTKLFPANGTMGTQSTITQSTTKLTRNEARRIAANIAKLPGPRGVGSMRPITPMSPATPICFPDKTDFVQTRLPLA
jgi:hypothetical protein